MLELIVLGQIPGTNIFVSFNELLLTLLASAIAGSVYYVAPKMKHLSIIHKQVEIEEQAI